MKTITAPISIKNLSYLFLVPTLKLKQEAVDQFDNFGFVDSYMECDKYAYTFKPLYLLFDTELTLDFLTFSKALEKNQNHHETVDLPDGKVLFVFRIPKRFEQDVEVFKVGRYDRLSPEFKTCFPITVDSKEGVVHTFYHHMFKGEKSLYQKLNKEGEKLIW